MKTDEKPDSLMGELRRYRMYFIPLIVFPSLFFLVFLVARNFSYPANAWVIGLLCGPFFFFSITFANEPRRFFPVSKNFGCLPHLALFIGTIILIILIPVFAVIAKGAAGLWEAF